MGYWKSKVLPKIKKVFDKNGAKRSGAADACKSFDDSKDAFNKDFEEKKKQLQSKVVELYEASSTEMKAVLKERNSTGIKKHATEVHKFIEELVKIDFPGCKQVHEASTKFGPSMIYDPITFVFEKVSTLIVFEEETQQSGKEEEKEKETVVVKKDKEEEVNKAKEEEEKEKETVVVKKEKEEEINKNKEEEEKTAVIAAAAAEVNEPNKVEEEAKTA